MAYDNNSRGYQTVEDNNNAAPAPNNVAPGDQRSGSLMERSWKLCKIFGIEIHIHILLPLFFIATLFCWMPIIAQDLGNTGWYVLLVLLFNVSLWETILIHELGHCLAGHIIGGNTDKVLLWPLGGLAFTQPPSTLNNAEGDVKKRKNFIIIAFGGPLTHIPHIMLYAGLISWYCGNSIGTCFSSNPFSTAVFWKQILVIPIVDNFWYDFLMLSFHINFWLFILNLFIPAYPLDGSRIFVNLLLNKYDTIKSAKIYAWVTGFLAAFTIIIAAFYLRSNTMIFFVGLWAAYQVYQMVMYIRAGQEYMHPLFASQ